ncbi:MAG: hypothetical protein JWM20_37 [Patescibacteria group bacterium]|nr:hypothetical protein [Patescibacteria group bacterium]
MKKLVTHNQGFHADDVMAYAILKEVLTKRGESWEIVRSRDQAVVESADIAFDIGYEYDVVRNRYDHHQTGRAGARPNGVLYASAGLIWNHFGRELCPSEHVWGEIDKCLIQEIDAIDSGQDYMGQFKFSDFGYTSLTIHIARFESMIIGEKTPEVLLKSFEEASEFARGILVRAIKDGEKLAQAFAEASEIYKNSADKQLPIFKKNYGRPVWKLLSEFPEMIFTVYFNEKNDDWRVEAIPLSPILLEARKYAPEPWRGLQFDELQTVSGVSDATFCHPSGFLFGAKSFEGAMTLAKKALLM